jgi:hypothetical protein
MIESEKKRATEKKNKRFALFFNKLFVGKMTTIKHNKGLNAIFNQQVQSLHAKVNIPGTEQPTISHEREGKAKKERTNFSVGFCRQRSELQVNAPL